MPVIGGIDNLADVDTVLPCKFIIALIMGRHRHHGTGAVFHQHEVGHPDRDFFAADRVDGLETGIGPLLFLCRQHGLADAGLPACVNEGGQCSIAAGSLCCQGMFSRDRNIGHTHHRIRSRGIDR